MISVSSLTRYGSHAAVEDVSFQISDKEVVGFLGLNGWKIHDIESLAGVLMPMQEKSASTVSMSSMLQILSRKHRLLARRSPSTKRCRSGNSRDGLVKSRA